MFDHSSHITIYGGHFTYVQGNSFETAVGGCVVPSNKALHIKQIQKGCVEPPSAFGRVQSTLQLLRHLVEPSHDPSWRKTLCDVVVLEKLVISFWEVCYGLAETDIGPLLRTALERFLLQCEKSVNDIHKALSRLLHRPSPQKGGPMSVLHSLWDWGNEADELLSLRLVIASLSQSLAEGIWSLKRYVQLN